MEHDKQINITILGYIKEAICKYIFRPLSCDKDDMFKLSEELNILYKNNDFEYEKWYVIVKVYTKLDTNSEIDNITGFIRNRVCDIPISSYYHY
tara:strand:+ start:172 stop:453 length:282 start_codon:yes stop_codon:yes gene_type:complete